MARKIIRIDVWKGTDRLQGYVNLCNWEWTKALESKNDPVKYERHMRRFSYYQLQAARLKRDKERAAIDKLIGQDLYHVLAAE